MNLYNGRPTVYERGTSDFNKGHGERFFRAFDVAFNLSPIQISREAMQRWDDFYSSLESTQVVDGERLDSTPYTPLPPSCSLKKTQAGLSDQERLTFPVGAFPARSNPNYTEQAGVAFITRHLNIPATSDTKTMLGAGQVSASSSSILYITVIAKRHDMRLAQVYPVRMTCLRLHPLI